ncbi:MAG: hypothetical protein Q4C66_06945 [Lachnospiraceae bacterium]|nr:hypothetical protein [Lachnospiraceae bacterium]
MIHILCLILKIIGWILLGILGIILGILLFVLFSAIRYQIDGKKQGKNLEGRVKVTWLLWILSVTAEYQDELRIAVKVFGRTIWKMAGAENEEDDFAGESGTDEILTNADHSEDTSRNAPAENQRLPEPQNAPETDRKHVLSNDSDIDSAESCQEDQQSGQPVNQDTQAEGRLLRMFRRLYSRLRNRISSIIAKLKFSIQLFCGKLKQAEERIHWLQEKWDMAQDFIQDPANQKSAKLILRQIKKILKHLFPRKGTAEITFGIQDPYQMGQILSAASLLYPFTHKILILHPVFDQAVLDGEIHIRGHVRIGQLLGYVLRLLFDRNIRQRLWRQLRPSRKQTAKKSQTGKS